MIVVRRFALGVVRLIAAVLTVASTGYAAEKVDYTRDINPLLKKRCYVCHSHVKQEAGLRLDAGRLVLAGGDDGKVVVRGKASESRLIARVRSSDADERMPPKGAALSADEIGLLQSWIDQGAKHPADESVAPKRKPHWAFQPISEVKPPVDAESWSDHPIDRFIRNRQREAGVTPVAMAARRQLIRRASFDLIGMPPTPKQVEAFIADKKPGAFARVVDQMLASPRYGERWGRHWLDLVRYADTAGENSDYPIREAYLYRDYVIDAFNADKPYDEFLHEQIAGDLLAKTGPSDKFAERMIATGFVAQAKRFGTLKLEDMHLIIEDTLHTMGQVTMGLSLRCARCHDHKFDPISMEDYYGLYGFFQSTSYPFPGSEETKKPIGFALIIGPAELKRRDAEHDKTIAAIKAQIASLAKTSAPAKRLVQLNTEKASLAARLKKIGPKAADAAPIRSRQKEIDGQLAAEKKNLSAIVKPIRDKLSKINAKRPSRHVPVAYAVQEGKPVDAKLQINGDPKKLGKLVKRGVPLFLNAGAALEVPAGGSGRLELARWLTGPTNPLTARVMVNRIWQHHFGTPIVATPSDFGIQGSPPTHPLLLDWLARDFVKSGWSIKALHRRIMLSKTYQLGATDEASAVARDAGNRWYWRFSRQRLDAESMRDSLLALGGNLDLKRPGPHPFPPVKKWGFTAHHQFKAVYPSNHRSVYLMVQRLHPHPYLAMFNGPDAGVSTAVRDKSTLVQQDLFMLNSKFVHKQAAGLAGRLISASPKFVDRVNHAYQLTFSRAPLDSELKQARQYHDQYLALLGEEGVPTAQREAMVWASMARVWLTANEFIFVY